MGKTDFANEDYHSQAALWEGWSAIRILAAVATNDGELSIFERRGKLPILKT